MNTNPFIVDTDWLLARLGDEKLSIVDASWYLPTMNRDGRAEYESQHIPGAVFFDIDDVCDPESELPHTLASPEVFAQKMGALGISNQDTIVVYDGMGLFSAPRAWWNFRVMGCTKVVILDGGLPEWIQHRLPIEAGSAPIYPKLFNAHFEERAVTSFDEIKELVVRGSVQIADARPAGRFSGVDPEPREEIRSGHMPGAKSVPFSKLAPDGKLLSADDLREVFTDAGLDLEAPVVTTCGSGVTAAALVLALDTMGHHEHTLYDGSWAEWGSREDTPVVRKSD